MPAALLTPCRAAPRPPPSAVACPVFMGAPAVPLTPPASASRLHN